MLRILRWHILPVMTYELMILNVWVSEIWILNHRRFWFIVLCAAIWLVVDMTGPQSRHFSKMHNVHMSRDKIWNYAVIVIRDGEPWIPWCQQPTIISLVFYANSSISWRFRWINLIVVVHDSCFVIRLSWLMLNLGLLWLDHVIYAIKQRTIKQSIDSLSIRNE